MDVAREEELRTGLDELKPQGRVRKISNDLTDKVKGIKLESVVSITSKTLALGVIVSAGFLAFSSGAGLAMGIVDFVIIAGMGLFATALIYGALELLFLARDVLA